MIFRCELQGTANGLVFWGAITDPDVIGLVGDPDCITFGWNECRIRPCLHRFFPNDTTDP